MRCSICRETFLFIAPFEEQDPPPPGLPRLEVAGVTSVGRVRTRNEDSFLIHHLAWSNLDRREELAVLVVADGMGGHEAGDYASGLTVRTVGKSLAPLLSQSLAGDTASVTIDALANAGIQALVEANREVIQHAKSESRKGMGATAIVSTVWNGQAAISHVGDCRAYHLHDGKLTQVTQDQTLVARMVEMGTLTPEEARKHPSRNEVSQAIGRNPDLKPSRHLVALEPGDWLLLACDGLPAHVDNVQLEMTLNAAPESAGQLAQELLDMTNQRGGSDNCTILAVRCHAP